MGNLESISRGSLNISHISRSLSCRKDFQIFQTTFTDAEENEIVSPEVYVALICTL